MMGAFAVFADPIDDEFGLYQEPVADSPGPLRRVMMQDRPT
jgi:hypothetical protein